VDSEISMIKYRPELDGLRAIAVLSVVLFHAGLKRFEGGFVGVDIFFVLSGFLITSIILKEIEENRFSFSEFYERRIRRLLPPIIPVIFVTGVLSSLFLGSEQLSSTMKSIYSTLGISSNWYFLSTVGYFDGPGHTTPLLHTWSLSIEEQFYIFFPVMLLLAFKLNKSQLPLITATLVASLLYSTYLVFASSTESAFYNSFGRFWELLIGASLACLKLKEPRKQIHRDYLEITGILMVLWSILKFEPDMPFPGPTALLPTLGTALLIVAGGKGRYISPALRSKPLVFIGLISYGLYLWHWPLLVFVKIVKPTAAPLLIAGAIAAAFVLAIISYHYLETPIRKRIWTPSRKVAYAFALAAVSTMAGYAALLSSAKTETYRSQASEFAYKSVYGERGAPIKTIEKERSNYLSNLNLNYTGNSGEFSPEKHQGFTCSFDEKNSTDAIISCVTGQSKKSNVIVIGDSIGRDTLHALRRAYSEKNFIMLHNSSCPATEFTLDKKTCFAGLNKVLEKIFTEISVESVLINFSYNPNSWKEFENGLHKIMTHSKKVVVLGVTPRFMMPVGDIIKSSWGNSIPRSVNKDDKSMIESGYNNLLEEAKSLVSNQQVPFVDLSPFYCPQESCSLWIDDDTSKPMFIDEQHLSEFGIKKLGEFLSKQPEIASLLAVSSHLTVNR
jgi:peptidoglycan/LPS O-acetylase OafA/YrhL